MGNYKRPRRVKTLSPTWLSKLPNEEIEQEERIARWRYPNHEHLGLIAYERLINKSLREERETTAKDKIELSLPSLPEIQDTSPDHEMDLECPALLMKQRIHRRFEIEFLQYCSLQELYLVWLVYSKGFSNAAKYLGIKNQELARPWSMVKDKISNQLLCNNVQK